MEARVLREDGSVGVVSVAAAPGQCDAALLGVLASFPRAGSGYTLGGKARVVYEKLYERAGYRLEKGFEITLALVALLLEKPQGSRRERKASHGFVREALATLEAEKLLVVIEKGTETWRVSLCDPREVLLLREREIAVVREDDERQKFLPGMAAEEAEEEPPDVVAMRSVSRESGGKCGRNCGRNFVSAAAQDLPPSKSLDLTPSASEVYQRGPADQRCAREDLAARLAENSARRVPVRPAAVCDVADRAGTEPSAQQRFAAGRTGPAQDRRMFSTAQRPTGPASAAEVFGTGLVDQMLDQHERKQLIQQTARFLVKRVHGLEYKLACKWGRAIADGLLSRRTLDAVMKDFRVAKAEGRLLREKEFSYFYAQSVEKFAQAGQHEMWPDKLKKGR